MEDWDQTLPTFHSYLEPVVDKSNGALMFNNWLSKINKQMKSPGLWCLLISMGSTFPPRLNSGCQQDSEDGKGVLSWWGGAGSSPPLGKLTRVRLVCEEISMHNRTLSPCFSL